MIDFQQVLQEYQRKGHILKQQLSKKPESSVYLMQNLEGNHTYCVSAINTSRLMKP